MRYGCSYCREKRGLRQEEAILASIMLTLGTRCNAWRDCCAEIMTSKCCIEHLKRDGRKPGSGERCCSKNAMHVCGQPLRGKVLQQECNACMWTAPAGPWMFSSYPVHFIDRKKIFWKLSLQEDIFLNLQRHNVSIKLVIPKSRTSLLNCSLILKHFDQNGIFYLRNNIVLFGLKCWVRRVEAFVMSMKKTHSFVKTLQNVHKCTKAWVLSEGLKAMLRKPTMFGHSLQLPTEKYFVFIERIAEVRIQRRGCCDSIFL